MTTSELLELDYREPVNVVKIEKALRKIEPFKDIPLSENIPMLKMEVAIAKLEKKTGLRVNYIMPLPVEKNHLYTARIMDGNSMLEVKKIYGVSLYELFSKLCIYFYTKYMKMK